ncbi:MAG: cysteine desulfurase family protein [Acidimicrobiales bacterium]|nr:cysteine desulfurase family protein [Acidimicrobiales bacterium]
MTEPRALVYLDHAATSPMRPEAVAAMLPHLGEHYGNPSGAHAMARAARVAIEDARDAMAAALGCDAGEIVFTGGGTEADNLAVAGVRSGRRVCSAIEHHAVLHSVEHFGDATFGVTPDGVADLADLERHLDGDVALVSLMLANNETGVVQPVADAAARVGALAPAAVVHCDAVAAFTWLDVATLAADAGLVSVSAHKFGGPKGVGALVVRDGVKLEPISRGGGQERERRSGTHNVAGIVAMAAAASAAVREREALVARTTRWRDELVSALPDVVVTAPDVPHTAGTLHVQVADVESEALVIALDDMGVCASAGSACASGALEPSHVLAAMGVDPTMARGALRLSMGWSTTDRDIEQAVVALPKAIEMLRSRS